LQERPAVFSTAPQTEAQSSIQIVFAQGVPDLVLCDGADEFVSQRLVYFLTAVAKTLHECRHRVLSFDSDGGLTNSLCQQTKRCWLNVSVKGPDCAEDCGGPTVYRVILQRVGKNGI
jgi:hypothetical protein